MRAPCTHCARSLSGVQITTCSTSGNAANCAARRRERVVALELDHRPHDDPERAARVLGRPELREQLRVDAVAGLVAGVEIVAERLDHVIERDRDVRDAGLAEQREHRAQQAAHGADLEAVGGRARRAAVVRAKQLERSVDEVNFHGDTIRFLQLMATRYHARAHRC